MNLLEDVKESAKQLNKRIILPESIEERTLKAADHILKEGLAQIILLGSPDEIKRVASDYDLKNIKNATIIDPRNNEKKHIYIDLLVKAREHKGMTKEEAAEHVENPLCLTPLIIKNGDADGAVAGAENATRNVLRPAFQILKTRPGINIVSGAFFMTLKDKSFGDNGLLVFADCAVNPYPTEEQLAEIAISTADTTKRIADIEPRIAMLSFSTYGSSQHELAERVTNATDIAREKRPDLKIDGELQADAALVEEIGKRKAKGSKIAGKANILIFPSLEAGNIGYKLVQRLAKATATGPVLQGLAAPINDLSRGSSIQDIVDMVAITSNMAMNEVDAKIDK
ncbi:MAG: phosphate acetyltransferase [Bacteroidales bacterium]